MSSMATCSYCGNKIPMSNESEGAPPTRCPNCGTMASAYEFEANPYAPPVSTPDYEKDHTRLAEPYERTSLFEKIGEALRLFTENLGVITMLVLTFTFLPNLMFVQLRIQLGRGNFTPPMILPILLELLLGSILVGSIVHVISLRASGERATYLEAIGVGFRNCLSMFWTRLITGLTVVLGLVVLIIPGIIFMLRYALVEPIVILEHENGVDAMKRSRRLSSTYHFQLFMAIVLLAAMNVLASMMQTYLIVFLTTRSNASMPTVALIYSFSNCALRVLTTLHTILPLVVYRESYNLHGPTARVSEWFLDKKSVTEEL